jgi:hypothetical protein
MAPCFENVVAFGLSLACKALQGFIFFVFKATSFLHGRRRRRKKRKKKPFVNSRGAYTLRMSNQPTTHQHPQATILQGYDSQIRQGPNFFHNIFSFVLVNNFY